MDIELLKSNMKQVPLVKAIEVNTEGKHVYGFQLIYLNGYRTKHHMGRHAHSGVTVKRIDL